MDRAYTWQPVRRSGKAVETCYVVVTGGVASSLGKGMVASSVAMLLSRRGLRVAMVKADPYLNVDAGTMAPGQHGEVFVTTDGGETDLDLGNYERFLDREMPRLSNITSGGVYSKVISRERRGEALGRTVQIVPDITDEIKNRIRAVAQTPDGVADVVVLEVGGTVGDIESQPFLEAVRQLRHETGRRRVQIVHVALVPEVGPNREMKTKPTQHSVSALRQSGLSPDLLVCRSTKMLPDTIKSKLAATCDVDDDHVISAYDAPSIYSIPTLLHKEGLDAGLVRNLNLPFRDVDWAGWSEVVGVVEKPQGELRVAIVGKYVESPDAYLSVVEALRAAGFAVGCRTHIKWVDSEVLGSDEAARVELEDVDALLVPGGFGYRGTEGMVTALRVAREDGLPTLGICLGMQMMVVEAARNLAGLEGASSTEFDASTPHPVVSTMEDQVAIVNGEGDMGGSMRLGSYLARIAAGTRMSETYQNSETVERHRHRYEVNNEYRELLERAGLRVASTSPGGELVEGVEVSSHPYYMGVQSHPEFDSRPVRPHPLFRGLMEAAVRGRGENPSDHLDAQP